MHILNSRKIWWIIGVAIGFIAPALEQNSSWYCGETKELSQTSEIVSNGTTGCVEPGDSGCTVILSPVDLSGWPNVTITIEMTSNVPFDQVLVEWSPNGVVWERWNDSAFRNLNVMNPLSLAVANNSRRWLRVEAHASAGITAPAVTYIHANR